MQQQSTCQILDLLSLLNIETTETFDSYSWNHNVCKYLPSKIVEQNKQYVAVLQTTSTISNYSDSIAKSWTKVTSTAVYYTKSTTQVAVMFICKENIHTRISYAHQLTKKMLQNIQPLFVAISQTMTNYNLSCAYMWHPKSQWNLERT